MGVLGDLWRTAAARPALHGVTEALALPTSYPGTTVTTRRVLNLYRSRWEKSHTRTRLRSYPLKLTVEAANICNLRCPACYTGVGRPGRKRSHMSPELFRRLITELGPYLWEVEFHNWGEPLLARNVVGMIEAAHAHGVHTTVSTNFSFPFTAERAEQLVASGLSVLGVSIDGAHQETYEQYRRAGNLDLVLQNCRLVRDARRKLGSATPALVWEFHVFEHNQHDVDRAKALAAELEMEIAIEKGWVVGPDWDVEHRYRHFADPSAVRCLFLWTQAVVNNDGGVSPCCGVFDPADDTGQMATDGTPGATRFREVWNNARFQHARGLYRNRALAPGAPADVCYECPQTKIWDRYTHHVAAGAPPETFDVGYSTNDCFNFFWRWRAPATPAD